MFGKKQKGFTVVELLLTLWFLFWAAFGIFIVSAIIYAIGKYLFGWWG